MPFTLTLGFATEHDRDEFVERILPKVRGQQAEPPARDGEPDTLHRTAVTVTSPSAARDVCHQVVAFLAHSKKDFVNVEWSGADGQSHSGVVSGESAKDAEI